MKAFLGAMTPNGFVNHFDEIIKTENGNKLFLLKGGSGVGKSTFMKKVVGNATSKKMEVSVFPCSNDIDSLDGIFIPQQKLAIIDATSPHLIDPKAYGFFDEIIDLGKSLNVDDKSQFDEVFKLQKEKQVFIDAFLQYFKSANIIFVHAKKLSFSSLNEKFFNKKVIELTRIFPKCEKKSTTKKMFISALTPNGYVDFISENSINKKTIMLEGEFDSVLSLALFKLKSHLIENGYSFIEFLSILEPDKPVALLVENTNTLIFYDSFLKTEPNESQLCIDFFDPSKKKSQMLENDKSVMALLLNHASNLLKNSSLLHDKIEKIYLPFVDFKKSDLILKEFIKNEIEL